MSFSRLGQTEEVKRVFREVLAREPGRPHANRNLGVLLAHRGRAEEGLPIFRKALKSLPDDMGATLGLADCLMEMGGDGLSEAEELYRSLLEKYPGHPITEEAKAGLTRVAQRHLRANVPGGARMDAVMYMHAAMRRCADMKRQAIGHVVLEIAKLGESGLRINEPEVCYSLDSLDGDFSGLELLCLMHVGFQQLQPGDDCGSGLDQEYEMAREMFGDSRAS